MNNLNFILSLIKRNVLLIPAYILILLFAWFLLLKDPPVWPDEPLFFDAAKNIVSTGKPSSTIHGAQYPELANSSIAYPPLYFVYLGSWIKIFGENIETIRLSSVFLGIVFITIFFRLLQIITKSSFLSFLGIVALSLNYNFIRSTHIARMEILTLCLIFLSIYLYLRSKQKLYFLTSCLISGLSFLSHPMGIIAPLALGILIFFGNKSINEKIRDIITVLLTFLLFLASWLAYFAADLSQIAWQWNLYIAKKAQNYSYFLTSMHNNNFKIIFAIYSFFLLGFIFTSIEKKRRLEISLAVLSIVSLTLSYISNEMWYPVYYEPFIIAALLMAIKRVGETKIIKQSKRIILTTVYIIQISVISWVNFSQIQEKIFSTKLADYYTFGNLIKEKIPAGSTVCISSIPDPYFVLNKEKGLNLREFLHAPNIKDRTDKLISSCDYLVINFFLQAPVSEIIKSKPILNLNSSGSYNTRLVKLR